MIAGPFHSQSSGIKTKNLQLANNRVDSYAGTGDLGLGPV
jgi:hypothetical protein